MIYINEFKVKLSFDIQYLFGYFKIQGKKKFAFVTLNENNA